MVDPNRMVIRPVLSGFPIVYESNRDIVIDWQEALENDETWFLERKFTCISSKTYGTLQGEKSANQIWFGRSKGV